MYMSTIPHVLFAFFSARRMLNRLHYKKKKTNGILNDIFEAEREVLRRNAQFRHCPDLLTCEVMFGNTQAAVFLTAQLITGDRSDRDHQNPDTACRLKRTEDHRGA